MATMFAARWRGRRAMSRSRAATGPVARGRCSITACRQRSPMARIPDRVLIDGRRKTFSEEVSEVLLGTRDPP